MILFVPDCGSLLGRCSRFKAAIADVGSRIPFGRRGLRSRFQFAIVDSGLHFSILGHSCSGSHLSFVFVRHASCGSEATERGLRRCFASVVVVVVIVVLDAVRFQVACCFAQRSGEWH